MNQKTTLRGVIRLTALLTVLMGAFSWSFADEGQWPLSMVHKLDLAKAGIKIPASEIYNDKKPSLVDAICRVGGATGSFVSNNGLILTNHHVAFDAVSKASTPEQDYLHDGFVAATMADEVIAQGYNARITVGYKDVSTEVLSAVKASMSPIERAKAIMAKRRSLTAAAKKAQPELDAEVAEMFQGKNYVLFQYELIQDVRMVVVPPRSVGEYGGETDNWIWPRHTGDFAFLRAYVGPDGKPAPYSKKNIPFTPRRFLKINAAGVSPGDAVFLLGYPGRTFRHQSSAFVAFDEHVKMPFVADLFEQRIRIMEEASKNDRALRLKLGPQIKGLANTMKNYRGKLLGLSRLKLVAKKAAEEAELGMWIQATPERLKKYGRVIEEINAIFEQMGAPTHLRYIAHRFGQTPYWSLATKALEAREFLSQEDSQRPKKFQQGRIKRALQRTANAESNQLPAMLNAELTGAIKLALDGASFLGLDDLRSWRKSMIDSYGSTDHGTLAQKISMASKLKDKAFRANLFHSKTESHDDVLDLINILQGPIAASRGILTTLKGKLDALMPIYVDAKENWKTTEFCPDANFTLRMTYGRIRSYEPKDGVIYQPLTTLSGMVAKATGEEPYDAPQKLIDLWRNKKFGKYMDKDLNDVPVGILYDCDTTGGNSGSPVMNAYGELIGLNFDRAYEATINDYQWSSDYSRSIGVDIRYVLWITEKLMGCKRVTNELINN